MQLILSLFLWTLLLNLFLLQSTFALSVDGEHFKRNPKPKRCSYAKKYEMMAADCYGLDFKNIPKNLRSDIEVLDISYNRIRTIEKDSFSRYTSLRYLYLHDNMISYIEDEAFEPLQYLEVIDLSLNSLDSVPDDILKLPLLRKLYINNNRLKDPFSNAPISYTLEFLSLSDCNLHELPSIPMYPNLKILNVSGNELKNISPQQLAPLCQLELLDLQRNPLLFKNPSETEECDCEILSIWLEKNKIKTTPGPSYDCTYRNENKEQCANVTESMEAIEKFNSCITYVETQKEVIQTRKTWIIVGVTLAAIVMIVIIVLYMLHRRNKIKSKKRSNINNNNGKIPIKEDEVTSNELLNEQET